MADYSPEDYSRLDKMDGLGHDPVNAPAHYRSDPSGIECIQITRHRTFNIGSALKYLWRAGLKDESAHIQDLEKAIFFIKDEIERLKHHGARSHQ